MIQQDNQKPDHIEFIFYSTCSGKHWRGQGMIYNFYFSNIIHPLTGKWTGIRGVCLGQIEIRGTR